MANSKPVLIVIFGPTASGKTDFALQLAKDFQTEILSVDSRQIYTEMSIGTAKPPASVLAEIKHHFINHCSVHNPYNAGIFEKEALHLLESLFKKHQVVIAAGGTGLYIKALCDGLDKLPKANENLRLKLQEDLDEYGIDYLFKKLQNLDLEGSKSIDSKNPHRIIRAIELIEETGQSITHLKTSPKMDRPFKIIKIRMDIERATLYQNINTRVDQMINAGWIEEARHLYPYKNLKALQTVGYKELFDYFDGIYTLPEAIDKIKQHTRNYAKRQLTWFKSERDCIPHHAFTRQMIM